MAWKSEELLESEKGLNEIADTLDTIISARIPGGMKFKYLELDLDDTGRIDPSKPLRQKLGWGFDALGAPLHPEAHVPMRIVQAARKECQQRPPHLQYPQMFKRLQNYHMNLYPLSELDDNNDQVFLSATEYLELQDLRFVVLGFHCHRCVPATCNKGGRMDCRFKFPFKLQPYTQILVTPSSMGATVKVDVKLKRNHAYVNTYNPAMAIALRGNSDVKYTAVNDRRTFLKILAQVSYSLLLLLKSPYSQLVYVTAYSTKTEQPDIKLLNDRVKEAIKRLPVDATVSQLIVQFANTMMGKKCLLVATVLHLDMIR